MNIEVDDSVVKQEEEERESAEVAMKEGDASCEVEDARGSINDEKNGGDDPLVLSDLSTADVPVMPKKYINYNGCIKFEKLYEPRGFFSKMKSQRTNFCIVRANWVDNLIQFSSYNIPCA
ncbi:hypothetical protein HanXRQr2_Chr10g0440091 [Helianthus annuus]|uniref:Uncharacterized protein n=1 Tax=Helianthus annuus TaxID=4232 RepID=A0A9K3N4N5_HELAN|nr:hypothetical protein HanXRQr2_Chr10g0440091 [Helianthus annuus]